MVRSFFEEKKNILAVFVGTILFIIYFFPYLGNTFAGLDTVSLINNPGYDSGWSSWLGRQGAALLRKIFNSPQFSMYFAEGTALLCFLLAMVAYVLLFKQLGNVDPWKSIVFFLFCMIHPIWTEQFYWIMQIFEMSVGMLLLPLILFMTFQKKHIWWIGSVPLSLILFSTYQTFVILYIEGCIICFLLLYIQSAEKNKKLENLFFFKLVIRQIVIFLINFILNTIISKKFFMNDGSAYLEDQVRWGIDPFQDCLKRVCSTIWQMLAGEGVFYSYAFSLSLIISLIGISLYLWKHKIYQEKWIAVSAYIVLQISSFMLSIYLGNTSAYRSQFNLPFVVACNILLVFTIYPKIIAIKSVNNVIVIGLAFVLLKQYYSASLLQYTTTLARQNDERRAYAIESEIINTTAGSTKPIALIGIWSTTPNNSCVTGELATQSIFEFGWWEEPRYSGITNWGCEYMRSLGIDIRTANADQVIKARHEAQNMPVFPLEGSVKELDDVIVVKISPDDYFASEAMDANVSKEEAETMPEANDQLNGYVDAVTLQDNVLTVNGWVLEQQVNSNYVIPAVHLWDEGTGTLYSLSSGTQSRTDLNSAFPDGTDYSHSGVLAKGNLDDLPEDSLEHCRILLSTTRNGETKYFDTGKYVTDYLANLVE